MDIQNKPLDTFTQAVKEMKDSTKRMKRTYKLVNRALRNGGSCLQLEELLAQHQAALQRFMQASAILANAANDV